MNMRQLECFKAVIQNGTMTKAAQEVGITQPAISNMIASLEFEIGFKLFERNGGRLVPTPEARALVHDAELTVGSFERTRRTVREIRNRNFGRLVIASYPGLSIHFLPRVVAEFLTAHPGVQIELHSRSSEVLHEILLTQRYDIAIADLPSFYPGIRTEPMTVGCKCVMRPDHRLARKRIITPQDLADEPIVSLFREHALTGRLATIFSNAAVKWNVIAETRLFESACTLVSHGIGVTIVDSITASEQTANGLVAKRFEPDVTFNIGLVYPPDRPVGTLLESFLALFRRQMEPFVKQAA